MITPTEEEIGTPLTHDLNPAEDVPMLVIRGKDIAKACILFFVVVIGFTVCHQATIAGSL